MCTIIPGEEVSDSHLAYDGRNSLIIGHEGCIPKRIGKLAFLLGDYISAQRTIDVQPPFRNALTSEAEMYVRCVRQSRG